MNQELAVSLGVWALFLWTWGYALCALHWFVAPALRTGHLEVRSGILKSRARTYSRAEQPILFWLGIAFWIAMAVGLAIPVFGFGMQIWQRFLA